MTNEIATEDQLISRAQQAVSTCNWVIGECAAEWTQRYAKGRTDNDFGALIGLSGDQVYQRRRVWQTFSDVRENYAQLKWSHFYVALSWDDAAECLQWANDMEATVAEMKAWRRSQHGEDLSEPADEAPFAAVPEYLAIGTGTVRMPDNSGRSEVAPWEDQEFAGDATRELPLAAASANREAPYAPFGKGARGSAPGEGAPPRDQPTAEQTVKRATAAIERAAASLTPEVLEEFHDLPIIVQQRFLEAVELLQSRAAGLS